MNWINYLKVVNLLDANVSLRLRGSSMVKWGKYKVLLVAKRISQKCGINSKETIKVIVYIMTIMAIMAPYDMELHLLYGC